MAFQSVASCALRPASCVLSDAAPVLRGSSAARDKNVFDFPVFLIRFLPLLE
jgi:hypothetical protein